MMNKDNLGVAIVTQKKSKNRLRGFDTPT